ncbi:sigma-54-dependent transcriptional regulator [Thiohalospira sp.]|uniref:sigma-54-dependent transcriptional regulator n=1 Tax=Thiohalospira sp. TaxID=3080549 RepID=UPI0039813608
MNQVSSPVENDEMTANEAEQQRDTILIAEDDPNMRELVATVLEGVDAEVIQTTDAQQALDLLESRPISVVLTDLRMPRIDGLELLDFARRRDPHTQVVLITGYGTVESAVDALKAGAFDYIRKPFDNTELLHTVERALEHQRLARENQELRQQGIQSEDAGLIGRSSAMDEVERLVRAAAAYDCGVLITGESGSGKELVAQRIHQISPRSEAPFVAMNCAAVPENIIESELFGYVRGAFTGADRNKPGLLEKAEGGTLFLDEINNSSLALQAKLLRILQDGTYYRIGDTEPRTLDARVLAASNRDLPELIEAGEFRHDLYYRLRVVEIALPPLRERRDDIPLLASYFLHKHARRLDRQVTGIETRVLGALMRHDWPGNVRELENVIQRMIIFGRGEKLDADALPPEFSGAPEGRTRALDYIHPQSLEELEAWFIDKTLREQEWDRGMSAEILGIDKSTLWRKMKRYGITDK